MFKNYAKKIKESANEIISHKKHEMIPLDNKEIKSYENQKVWHICKKEFRNDDKNKKKVKCHCHYTGKLRGAAHSECSLKYKVPK